MPLKYLSDLWDESRARTLDAPALLRYRSNLLGSDLRITNFGGGNTSSKLEGTDPLDGAKKEVLWVKGSGGDLGSIKVEGFATLYMDKVLALSQIYRGVEFEDEIVGLYPLCTFGNNPVAASIDTALHAFLPFPHVDHLHPDWGIALAASANGKEKMDEFNRRFNHKLVWVPWQRPGFELAMMLERAVKQVPGCDGVVLGGHGLFTWGSTQRESYLNTITIIDQIGQFIEGYRSRNSVAPFGGGKYQPHVQRQAIATKLMPFLRGQVSSQQRMIGSFTDIPEILEFINSHSAAELAH
jgi:rhamnose utilization protein RhaD (predicted bifunctional aldolase and dehydrogenase)